MDEGVQDLHRLIKGWGDEDLVALIGRAASRPTLADMVASSSRAGEAARNLTIMRQFMAFLLEKGADSFHGSQ